MRCSARPCWPSTSLRQTEERDISIGEAGDVSIGDLQPDRVWNRILDAVRGNVIKLALVESSLSPRELAVRFTDSQRYFVSEASVYRLLKARDLIASPAFIVINEAPSNWWTPLLSSGGSGKVSNEPGTASFYG